MYTRERHYPLEQAAYSIIMAVKMSWATAADRHVILATGVEQEHWTGVVSSSLSPLQRRKKERKKERRKEGRKERERERIKTVMMFPPYVTVHQTRTPENTQTIHKERCVSK